MTNKWLRLGALYLRFTVLGAIVAAVASYAMAQSLVATHAYTRATLPGIPGEHAKSVLPPTYYIYVEVKRGSQVSAEWAWVRGKYFDCVLRKVITPVTVESDPVVRTEMKETLVPKTANDVYRVVLGDAKERMSSDRESGLIANNEAVIGLVVNSSRAYAAVKSIKPLRPAAAN
jgi:hypothetical protein